MADFGITLGQGEAIAIFACIPLWAGGVAGYKACLVVHGIVDALVDGFLAAWNCEAELSFCTQSAEAARQRCTGQ